MRGPSNRASGRGSSGSLTRPVGDLVAEMDELVRREEARQLGGADVADLDAAILDHIGVGDLARRTADGDGDVIIAVR